jgi:hypothetical protein
MKNIPEDIAKDAQRVLKETMSARDLEHEAEIIASAIMAERERCAKIAEESYASANFADRSPKHIATAIRGEGP